MEVLENSAYGTGEMLAALQAAGHEPLVKPWPINSAVSGRFTVDDFTVNPDADTVNCPNGVTRTINRTGQVTFGVACRGCPLRAFCTRSATGQTMRIREHDAPACPPGPGPPTPTSRPATAGTGRWSNGP